MLTSLHLKTTEDVVGPLRASLRGPAWVAPPVNGWTSVYPSLDDRLAEIAAGCSQRLGVAALAVTSREDRFDWKLYESGKLVHEGTVSRGSPPVFELARLLPYCEPGTTVGTLQEILGEPHVAAVQADRARAVLEQGMSVFRTLPPDVIQQLMEQVQKTPGIPADHPMLKVFQENPQAFLDKMAEAASAAQAEVEAQTRQQTAMEPSMRLLGNTATIPVPLDRLARQMGLEQRMPLTYALLDDPQEEGWQHVIGEV